MNIKIDHINLTVRDLNESIDWYRNILGFELAESDVSHLGARWGILAFRDSMICITEDSERHPADSREDKSFHQIYHFGVRVSDLTQWQKTVDENQLTLNYGGPVTYPSSKSWYIRDPSGHEIEVSYAPSGKILFPDGGAR